MRALLKLWAESMVYYRLASEQKMLNSTLPREGQKLSLKAFGRRRHLRRSYAQKRYPSLRDSGY
jgi:hypothetical protein